MKILFLSKDYTYNGGGERMLCNLANELSQTHNVSVWSMDKADGKKLYTLDGRIKFNSCGIKRRKINFFTKFDYIRFLLSQKETLDKFDCIIAVGIICNLVLAFCAPRLKAKTIGWEHFCYDGTPFYQKILRKFLFKNLNHVVILTNRDLKKYKRLNPNTTVIYNFTLMTFRQKPKLENKEFLFIGRLSKQKGIRDFCDIIELFCKKNTDWKFRVIGDGKHSAYFETFINNRGLSNRINWSPISSNIQEEIELSSCMLMTSKYEGLPMVLIEASVCGLPAISYDTPTGPSDIIQDNASGFIVTLNDKAEFVKKMLNFTSDLNLQQRLSHESINQSFRFNKKEILRKWEEIL